jgi:predicted nucleic acid-binding protein
MNNGAVKSRVLVDSDILIEVSRGKDSNLLSRWVGLSDTETEVLYSPVSEAELWAGARPDEFGSLTYIFQALNCVPIDRETGRQAGNYLRLYARSHGVRMSDALIAAGAWRSGASLWTRNRKHFPMREIAFY